MNEKELNNALIEQKLDLCYLKNMWCLTSRCTGGKTIEELIALLGKPPRTVPWKFAPVPHIKDESWICDKNKLLKKDKDE